MTERLVVGRIVTAHGLRGECSVEPLTDSADRFKPGSVLDAELPSGEMTTMTVHSSRPHKSRLLVVFDGVVDRNAAEALRGTWLRIDAEQAAPLPDGRFYLHQLDGCDVFDEAGERLGVLTGVLESPAHDIWVVTTPSSKESLIPVVSEFIRDVDLEARRIVIAPIEGMIES